MTMRVICSCTCGTGSRRPRSTATRSWLSGSSTRSSSQSAATDSTFPTTRTCPSATSTSTRPSASRSASAPTPCRPRRCARTPPRGHRPVPPRSPSEDARARSGATHSLARMRAVVCLARAVQAHLPQDGPRALLLRDAPPPRAAQRVARRALQEVAPRQGRGRGRVGLGVQGVRALCGLGEQGRCRVKRT